MEKIIEPTFITDYNPNFVPQKGFAEFLDSLVITKTKTMTTVDKIIEGLQIIKKYDTNAQTGGDHDVFMVAPGIEEKMSPEDIAKMKELGWRLDEYQGWSIYV